MDQHDILEWTSETSPAIHSCIDKTGLLYDQMKLLEKEKMKRVGKKSTVMLIIPNWIKRVWDNGCLE